jgi:molybdate transport repressor ModE-like protein
MRRTRPAFKLWLETEEGYVFGPGVFSLLNKIEETGTLKEAARELGMSYRYAWGLVRRAEDTLGEPLISASKGGRLGGGSTEVAELGRRLIDDFERLRDTMARVSGVHEADPVEGVVKSIRLREGEANLAVSLTSAVLKMTVDADSIEGLREGDPVKLGFHLA